MTRVAGRQGDPPEGELPVEAPSGIPNDFGVIPKDFRVAPKSFRAIPKDFGVAAIRAGLGRSWNEAAAERLPQQSAQLQPLPCTMLSSRSLTCTSSCYCRCM